MDKSGPTQSRIISAPSAHERTKTGTENRNMQKLNKQLFAAAFIGGLFLGSSNPLTVWIHEQGHLQSFRMSGIQAQQTDYNHVVASAHSVTLSQLISGAMSELMFFFFAFWFIFCSSNPRFSGFRGLWCWTGIPVGAIAHIWIRAYSYTDFHREFSADISLIWTVVGAIAVVVVGATILIWRWGVE